MKLIKFIILLILSTSFASATSVDNRKLNGPVFIESSSPREITTKSGLIKVSTFVFYGGDYPSASSIVLKESKDLTKELSPTSVPPRYTLKDIKKIVLKDEKGKTVYSGRGKYYPVSSDCKTFNEDTKFSCLTGNNSIEFTIDNIPYEKLTLYLDVGTSTNSTNSKILDYSIIINADPGNGGESWSARFNLPQISRSKYTYNFFFKSLSKDHFNNQVSEDEFTRLMWFAKGMKNCKLIYPGNRTIAVEPIGSRQVSYTDLKNPSIDGEPVKNDFTLQCIGSGNKIYKKTIPMYKG